jgi:hypothetical protein
MSIPITVIATAPRSIASADGGGTKTQPKSTNPIAVQQALQRWVPLSKDNTVFALKDTVAPTKPALDFVASPTKVGLLDWGKTMLTFGALPLVCYWGVEQLTKKSLQSTPTWLRPTHHWLKEQLGPSSRGIGMALPLAVGLGGIIQMPFSFMVAKAQHTTNEKVLKTLEKQGINAPLGNTLRQ